MFQNDNDLQFKVEPDDKRSMNQKKAQVFVLEDAEECLLILKATLTAYDVVCASTIADAESLIAGKEYDLFILDITLPDGESFSLCEKLRSDPRHKNKPILFLSARGGEVDKLSAFARGADDYVTKPFSALELKARVESKLRHWDGGAEPLKFGELTIDIEKRKVWIADGGENKELNLTGMEFDLLIALTRRPEVVKTRQALLDEVWGADIAVTDRTIDVHVYNLRKKLGSFGKYIHASHGQGYFFRWKPAALRAA